jgi:hypothetical protein
MRAQAAGDSLGRRTRICSGLLQPRSKRRCTPSVGRAIRGVGEYRVDHVREGLPPARPQRSHRQRRVAEAGPVIVCSRATWRPRSARNSARSGSVSSAPSWGHGVPGRHHQETARHDLVSRVEVHQGGHPDVSTVSVPVGLRGRVELQPPAVQPVAWTSTTRPNAPPRHPGRPRTDLPASRRHGSSGVSGVSSPRLNASATAAARSLTPSLA